MTGAVLTTNRLGQADSAYSFNGAAYIQVNDLDPDSFASGFSFGSWVCPQSNGGWLYWNYDAGWGSSFLATEPGLHFRIGTGSQATDHGGLTNTLPTDQWSHVLVSHSPSNDQLFLNGALIGQWPSSAMSGNVNFLRIGQGYDFLGFQGAVDEVVVFSRALSPSDVRLLHRVGLSPLKVLFDSVMVTPSNVTIVVSGATPGSWSVDRANSPAGPWTYIGSLLIDSNGTGSFTDTNPPADIGYYRARQP